MANKPLRTLYDSLKANNYDVPADYGSFERTLTAPGKQGVRNRQTLYQSLKANNYDVPDTYESFSRTLFAPVNPGMSRLPGDVAERRVRTRTPQQTHPLDKSKARRQLQAQQQAIENQQKRWEQDNKRFKEDIARREQRLPGGMDRFEQRAKEQLATGEAAPVHLAPNDDVVRGDIAFNPQTGRMQQTYTTPEGGTFFDRNTAEFDHSLQNMPDDEIGLLERERELIGSGILRRGRELDEEYESKSWWDRFLAGLATDPEMGPGPRERMAEEDEELQSLLTAWRKNRDALRILYDERDNNMNSFWHNFGTTVANGYTFTGGRAELHDAQAILNSSKRMDEIQRKMKAGEQLSNVENAALRLAQNTAWDNAIQAMYGDDYGAWATAGGAAVQSLEMMPEFIAGMPALKGLGSAAIKLLARNAANGLGRFMLKGLGMTLGTMAGGAVMANTIQAERTLGKAAGNAAGSWWFGDDGEFMLGHYDGDQFVPGGESLASALFHAEQDAIPEAASEGAGEFLPGIGQVLSKIGLSRIAKPLATLSGKGWYKTYQNMLRAAGWHGVGGEALEEYVGTLDGLIMGDVEGVKRLADPRTHFDIWLSCATLGPLLNAPVVLGSSMRGVYSPVAYHKIKAAVTRQDKIASFRLTEDRWAPWRERIDDTPNEQMADLMMEVRDSKDLAPQEKKAIFDYVKALQGYRGWNLGEYIFGKDAEEEGNGKTEQEQQQSQEYSNGYETVTPEERRAAKDRLDVARARLEQKGYTEQWMQWVESTPIDDVMSDLTERGLAGDTEAVTEYLHAKAAYDGMLARVNDDIDDDVAVAGEAIEQRVAPENAGGDGMIHPAALKDGREVFIVSGNVATLADNSIDVENSDSMIIVRDADGQLHNITPSDIESLGEVQDPAQQRQQVEQEITNQQSLAAAAQIEGQLPFNVGDQYTINYQGQPHTYQVVDADENNVAVLVDGAQEPVVLTKQQLQQMADEEHAQQIQAQAVATDAVDTGSQPVTQDSTEDVEQAGAPVEETPAAHVAPEDNPTAAMPTDDQGEPAWYQVEPERGHQYLYQESGWPQAMADNFVQARIDEADKALTKAQNEAQKLIDKPKKTVADNNAAIAETNAALQAAQAALDYWNAVKAIQGQATAPVVEETAPVVETPAEQEPTEQAAPEPAAPVTPEANEPVEETPAVEEEKPEQSLDAAVAEAEQMTDTNPTDAQKESGNYRKGHVTIEGLDISIEQPKGSVRSGVDADGHEWSQEMHNTYGYIRGTEGVDGDHIDVFLSDHLDDWNGLVFVVDQVNKDGSFDEHKVMLGFNSTNEAKDAYLSNYKEGWTGLGDITVINIFDFKDWINSSHRKTKPFAEYKIALENAILEEEESEQPAAPVAENEMQPVEEPTADNGGAAVELSPEMEIVQEAKSRYPGENRIVILHYGDHYKVFNEDAERLHEALGDEFPITEMDGEGGIDKVMVITPEQIGNVLPAAIKAGLRVPLMRQAPNTETAQSAATEDQDGGDNAPQSDAIPEQDAEEVEPEKTDIEYLQEEFADELSREDIKVEVLPETFEESSAEMTVNVTVDGQATNIWFAVGEGNTVDEHWKRIYVPFYEMSWQEVDDLAEEYNQAVGKAVCDANDEAKSLNFYDIEEAIAFEKWMQEREQQLKEQQAEAESSIEADIQYSIEQQGEVPMGNKQKKFDMSEANKSGNGNEKAYTQGVYHDPKGYAVSSDGHILVVNKRAYDAKNKGKLIASKKIKKGSEIKEPIEKGADVPIDRYPNWRSVKITANNTDAVTVDFKQFADWMAGVEVRMKEQWQQWKDSHPTYKRSFAEWSHDSKVQILMPDGKVRLFDYEKLKAFARAAADLDAKKMRYLPNNADQGIQAESKHGFALLMPLNLYYYQDLKGGAFRALNGMGVDQNSSFFTYDMSKNKSLPGTTAGNRVELNYESGKDAESRAYIEEVMEREGWDEDAKSEFRKILDDAADLVSRLAQGFSRLREWNNKKLTDENGNYNPLWRVFDDKNGWVPTRSSFKKNGEYPYNIDLGALCTKREAFDAVVRYIKEQGWGQNLGPTQIEALKSLLREHGFLTACDICFNETKRARALDYGNAVAYYWNAVRQAVGIDDDLPIGTPRELTEEQTKILTALAASKNGKAFSKYIPKEVRRTYETYINSKGKRKRREADKGLTPTMTAKIAKLFLQDPSLMGRFEGTTLLSTDSVDALVRQYPHTTIAEFIAGAWGSATPKPNEGFNIYDPLSWKQSYDKKRQRPSMEWFFNLGGFRAQSFSDYHPIFFYDYVQMFTDLAIRRLPIHIYTKVPALIKLFGGTGAKFNMSLVPEVVQGVDAEHLGLKPDGNGGWELAWHEDSFPVDEAFALRQDPRFKGNVGTIAVGISDAHIRMLLDDPRIDMVIPYHKSGMPKSVQIKTGLNNATDYTDDQKTKGKKKGLKDFSFNEALRRLGDPRKAADEYLAWCKQNKCTPKFPQFADHPNYYKVLEDFRCIDNEGNYSPQQPVQVSFFDDVEQRLSESLEDKTMQEGLDNAIRGNDAITEGIEKIMSKPRLDGKIRDMMLARLKQVLGMNNVASLKQEDFFEELQKVYTDQMGAERAQQQVEVLRTSGGIVYGFAVGNRIVLNENYFNAETPMHEFTHVWVKVARLANPQMWAEGKELLKQTKEWQDVMSDEFYRDIQGDEDAVASEVLARIVGQDAARQVNEMFAPEDKPQERPGIYNKIKQWVNKFLDGVRSLFSDNAKGLTYDELVRMPMKALFDDAEAARFMEALQQVNEEDVDLSSQGSVPTFYSNAARAVENVKQNKATAEQWKAMLMKQGGIKAGEDKWMGLSTWLDEHKGETLTKDEVMQFVRDNAVQMEEVNYEDIDNSDNPRFTELQEEYDSLLDNAQAIYDENAKRLADFVNELEKKYGEDWSDNGFRKITPQEEMTYQVLARNQEQSDPTIYGNAKVAFDEMINRYGDDFAIAFSGNKSGLYISNNEYAAGFLDTNAINETRLDYTTADLDNKREIAFVVPNVEPYQESDEIHFGPENEGRAVMWVRYGEAHDTDGNRVLVIDEIQSNRHQDAREKGYADPKAVKAFNDWMDAKAKEFGVQPYQVESRLSDEEYHKMMELANAAKYDEGAIPAAPFEKNWYEVAMKRMLRLAAEEGFDKVAWTTGEQQADRYGLSGVVEQIAYVVTPNGEIDARAYYEDGYYTSLGNTWDDVARMVGKDLARRMQQGEHSRTEELEWGHGGADMDYQPINYDYNVIEGDGLKIGGEGMRAFYDGMLPQFMNKYGKRWGVKVGEVTLDTPGKEVMHSVDVTPEMRRSVMTEGQPLFQIKKSKGDQTKSANFKNWFGDWENDPENASKVVDAEGRPLVVYHQTNAKRWINRETGEDWEKLDWRKKMEWENKSQEEWEDAWEEQDFYTFDDRYARQSIEMPAIFFSPENDPHHEYGNRTIAVYLNMRNPAINPDIPNRGVTDTAGRDAMEALKAQGYDGFIRTDEDGNIREYGVFDSNQVKSADEVTFDDEGNEIPDEERYNPDEQDIRYRELDEDEDAELIDRLENGPHITTYSTKIKVDDGYVPPMSSKDNETGEMRAPEHEQKWNESEERPDLAKQDKKTGKWKFDLKKSNDKDVNGVLYNPYNHSGSGMLNDQFSEAQDRDDLVVVEQVVPQSEETDKYKAEKANDPTGWKAWKAGPITAKMTGKRKVFLSRWHKITRVVPWSEVADAVAKDLGNQFDVLPTNPFPPQLRNELEDRGYKFIKTDNKCVIQEGEYKGATWSERYYDVYPERAKDKDKKEKGARAKAVKEKYTKDLFDYAKKRFGVTTDFNEAGYILPDGTMLDFSGRHELNEGDDSSFLKGRRTVDHRYVSNELSYQEDGWTPTGIKTSMTDFIERGAIRINGPSSINLAVKPTKEQAATLRRYLAGKQFALIDFGNGDNTEHYAAYGDDIDPNAPAIRSSRVLADIDRYFDDGIKPEGTARYRDILEDGGTLRVYQKENMGWQNVDEVVVREDNGQWVFNRTIPGRFESRDAALDALLAYSQREGLQAHAEPGGSTYTLRRRLPKGQKWRVEGVPGEFNTQFGAVDNARNFLQGHVFDVAEDGNSIEVLGAGSNLDNMMGTDTAAEQRPTQQATAKQRKAEERARKWRERTVANGRRRVEELGQRLGVKVTIVDDMSKQERDGMSKKKRRAKGWYDVRTGEVFINLGNHKTVSDIEATFLHEVVAHKGLRRLFGDEFDKFLHNVYYNVDASIREEINRLMAKNNWDYREATEEYLAKLAQQMNFERPDRYLKAWDTVARLFRTLLQKMGLGNGMNLKDSDLQGILFESYHNMEKEGVAGLAESVEFRDWMEREANRRVDNATYQDNTNDTGTAAENNDSEYLDAVEKSLDKNLSVEEHRAAVEDIQRMLGKAFMDRMGTELVKEDGMPLTMWHTTPNEFTVFDKDRLGENTDLNASNEDYAKTAHVGFWTNTNWNLHDKMGFSIGGNTMPLFVVAKNPLRFNSLKELATELSNYTSGEEFAEKKKNEGYDSVILNDEEFGGVSCIVFDSNQLKSAALRTYDNDGNLIPLSERFNPEKEDIRFRDDEDDLEDFDDEEDFYEEELEEEADNAEDMGEDFDDSEAGASTFQEMMLGKMLQAANSAGAAQSARVSAMRSLGGALQQIRKAMSAQRNYDRETVNTIVRLAREVMASGYFNDLTRGEVKRLLAAAKNANGSANVTEQANKVVDTLLRHHLRECENLLKKQLKVKGSKTNPSGVEVQAGLDIEGQRMTTAMKQGIRLDEPGLRQRVAECLSRMGSSDPVVSSVASQEYTGLMLAQQYHDTIKKSRQEEQNMREEMRQVKAEFAARRDSLSPDELKRQRQDLKDYIAATEDAIRQNRMERADAYNQLSEMLGSGIGSSMERAKQWREQQRERVGEIQHNANSDLEGVPADEHMKPTWKHRMANWSVVRFFMKPLATFDYMLRMMGQKSPNGEGYLWNRFMGGWVEANDKEWRNVKAAHQVLDDKVKEVFGRDITGLPKFKVKRWSDLFFIERKMKGMDVDFWDDDQIKTHTLTPGNLLYIYMVNKMSDGKMKLRKMGISEEDVEAIKNHLDPRLIELADWLQDEFLVQKRVEYNAVHERMFGAPMAAIENYFPLKINDRSRSQEEDVNNQDANPDDNRGSTITGAIIKRVRNNKALDVTGADAFDVILEHIQTMEHWAAFAEFNRDLNTLLSYKRFRNRMLNMASTRFGSGKKLWTNFKRVCAIASGVYRPKVDYDSVDTNLVNVAKGVTRAKISFRFYTALKQLLSYPAYLSTANPIELAKSSNPVGAFKAWNWAIDNLPGFAERWQSRQAGDTRLKESDADWGLWKSKIIDTASRWGMSPNAFIDALTVAMGAKAIYETKFKQYKKLGYPEEQAKRRAQRDASVAYNETQQSSANAYTSAMQLDRTAASVALTVFRNASMGYQRRLFQSFANLKHMATKGYKAQSLEYLAKQMERDGLDKPTAEAAANKVYNRTLFQNIADVAIFGWVMQAAWNLGAYLPYLFMGDDDDDKKDMLTDAALHAIAGGVEGLTGGSVISDTYNSIRSGDAKATYSNELLPLLSDIESLKRTFKKDVIEGANDLVNLIVQAGVGVNPQTITDWVVAGLDMANGDPELANEWGLLVMRVMSAPQGQLDQLYIDELGMTAGDARKLNAEEFAQRYARYKMGRESTFTGWAYSEQGHNDAVDRYVKNFGKKVKERLVGNDIATLDDAFERGDGYMKDIVGKAIKTRLEAADDSELPTIYKYTTNEVTKKTAGREMAKRIAKNEDLDDYFDKQRDPVLRKAAASEIAKRLGTQDYAGKAQQAKWTQETKDAHERYQDLRTAADVNEDCQVTLLKVSDDDKAELREIKKQLGQGGDDDAIMQEYREARAEILKRYKQESR